MGLRINQNIEAMNAHRSLSATSAAMSKSLEKLSSGFRINRAADDAAGLSISEGLRAQIGGLKVAVRNAQDGVSVAQTAEGAMTEVHSILQRMRDLSVQAANSGSSDTTAREALQLEVTQLNAELNRIGGTTAFGGQKLLDGTFGGTPATVAGAITGVSSTGKSLGAGAPDFTIAGTYNGTTFGATPLAIDLTSQNYATAAAYQTELQTKVDTAMSAVAGLGYVAGDLQASVVDAGNGVWNVSLTNEKGNLNVGGTAATVEAAGLRVANVNATVGGGGTFQVGANNTAAEQIKVAIDAVNATSLGTSTVDLVNSASTAITAIDSAIGKVSKQRASLGAFQNRFERTINNLNVAVENLSASESRIRDTDMAQEMVSFTRAQILSQAGTAMLAQANQAPQSVLQLLR